VAGDCGRTSRWPTRCGSSGEVDAARDVRDERHGDESSLRLLTSVDAGEQIGGRDPKRPRELGDRSDARLALAALYLGDVRHVEVGRVCEPFLTEAAFLPDAS
jgi:hypothetical protein